MAKKLARGHRPVLVSRSGHSISVEWRIWANRIRSPEVFEAAVVWKVGRFIEAAVRGLLEGSGGLEMLGSLWWGACGLGVLLELLRGSCWMSTWKNNNGEPNPKGNVCLILSLCRLTLVLCWQCVTSHQLTKKNGRIFRGSSTGITHKVGGSRAAITKKKKKVFQLKKMLIPGTKVYTLVSREAGKTISGIFRLEDSWSDEFPKHRKHFSYRVTKKKNDYHLLHCYH